MRKIKTFWNVTLPYFLGEAGKVLKVLFYEAVIILVACGILYILNFRFSIEKRVQVISPISQEAL